MKVWKRRKPVAVLGCGPAGIFAAHALALMGTPVTIFSNKRRSDMFGAQYLHAQIPGLSGRSFVVDYRLRGTVAGYSGKVYGDGELLVSPANLVGQHDAWDIREAYYRGYELYESRIEHKPEITPEDVKEISTWFEQRVICTIPLRAVCLVPTHRFEATTIYAIGDAPERGIEAPVRMTENTVVCNGDPEPAWYRASTILGYSTVEWPGERKPPYEGVASVIKPIRTTCDCHRRMLRLGRYGSWTKGVLSHEAYFTTAGWMR